MKWPSSQLGRFFSGLAGKDRPDYDYYVVTGPMPKRGQKFSPTSVYRGFFSPGAAANDPTFGANRLSTDYSVSVMKRSTLVARGVDPSKDRNWSNNLVEITAQQWRPREKEIKVRPKEAVLREQGERKLNQARTMAVMSLAAKKAGKKKAADQFQESAAKAKEEAEDLFWKAEAVIESRDILHSGEGDEDEYYQEGDEYEEGGEYEEDEPLPRRSSRARHDEDEDEDEYYQEDDEDEEDEYEEDEYEEDDEGGIEKIISGGQTGADQGGLEAGEELELETGGWMPRGWLTLEDGEIVNRPEFEERFGMSEHGSPSFQPRTVANVRDSDATIIFVDETQGKGSKSRGSRATEKAAKQKAKKAGDYPYTFVDVSQESAYEDTCDWLTEIDPRVLNVAGNRESSAPGIQETVRGFLVECMDPGDAREQRDEYEEDGDEGGPPPGCVRRSERIQETVRSFLVECVEPYEDE